MHNLGLSLLHQLSSPILAMEFSDGVKWAIFLVVGAAIVLWMVFSVASKIYRKVGPEEAIVRSGSGGLMAATGQGILVIPVFHRAEHMDLSVKRIEIARRGLAGLICKDNIRADIEVAFFVRVNNTKEDILNVAQALGCRRASEQDSLNELFGAKFSEALKTVGKHFDFVELYNQRDNFKEQILKVIGTDLNGYVLDDCAIDFLEQTPLEMLNPNNILDAEGIKKITDLTAREHVLANEITREKEKTIKKQDVAAQEAILELERQRVEAVQKQEREIAAITAREHAAAAKVREEERLKAEQARIATEEAMQIAEENRMRQVIVARKNKERTEAVEQERITRDRDLEITERTRVVSLAEIEKEKVIETEKRNIQEVIRERVMVQRSVVEEQQKIKDTEEFATADRLKKVTITKAEMEAEQSLVKEIKAAEASKQAAEHMAKQQILEAQTHQETAEREAKAKKMMAEAVVAESAAKGLGEAHVIEAKAAALEKQGRMEAVVLEQKAIAEARGIEAMAQAQEKEGTVAAQVLQLKLSAEATGIEEKANAMKLLDGVGREHEEFKLRLQKDKEIEIAAIHAQQEIAEAQSTIVGEALKHARIDIVGGETTFFDKIVDSIKGGKAVDRFVNNSGVLTDVKNTFFNGNPDYFRDRLENFISMFNMDFDDVKNLSISAVLGKMLVMSDSDETRFDLQRLLDMAKSTGYGDRKVGNLGVTTNGKT